MQRLALLNTNAALNREFLLFQIHKDNKNFRSPKKNKKWFIFLSFWTWSITQFDNNNCLMQLCSELRSKLFHIFCAVFFLGGGRITISFFIEMLNLRKFCLYNSMCYTRTWNVISSASNKWELFGIVMKKVE